MSPPILCSRMIFSNSRSWSAPRLDHAATIISWAIFSSGVRVAITESTQALRSCLADGGGDFGVCADRFEDSERTMNMAKENMCFMVKLKFRRRFKRTGKSTKKPLAMGSWEGPYSTNPHFKQQYPRPLPVRRLA